MLTPDSQSRFAEERKYGVEGGVWMLQSWGNVSSFNAVPSDGAVWPGLAAGGVTY